MKPVTQVVTVTLLCILCLLPVYYGKASICSYPTLNNSMCLNTTNPIVWYNTSADTTTATSFVDLYYPTLLASYNSTGNVTDGCVIALQELICTFYFKPCNLDSVSSAHTGICNSTTLRVLNECSSVPSSPPLESFYPYVDDNNPSCAYAYQPQCTSRLIARAGEIVAPYRIDNNYGLNYNYTAVCDLFSYSDSVAGDNICKEMPDFGSPCPEGTGWTPWFNNLITQGVKCKGGVFTLEYKRHGDPCLDQTECLNSNCTAGYCYETDNYCTTMYSCRPGMYCYSNNTCVPLRVENEACTSTDPCVAPLSCVLGNCTRPAAIGEPCDNMSPGDTAVKNAPFCGPPINTIYDVFTTCAANTCSYSFTLTIGSPCLKNGDPCDPFTSLCNGTDNNPAGYCVPPEQIPCSIDDNPCDEAFYCDCTGGAGKTGVCRVDPTFPLVGCQTEYVQLYGCLRSKCDAYDMRGQFYDPSYYPFDGYSCGDTKCANETKVLYCCMADLNGGVAMSNISVVCETATPTPTLAPTTVTPTTTSVPTTSVAPTTTAVPTTTVAPTTSSVAPTTTATPTTTPTVSTTTAIPTTFPPSPTPTTTGMPTTTANPITTATIVPTTTTPLTTTSPPTAEPTTSKAPTTSTPTTITTTKIPTTLAPVVTSAPIAVTTGGTLSATGTGNIAEIPKPVVNNSVVLYTSANASSVVPLSFANTMSLPKDAVIQEAQVSFKVTYIEKKVTVLITLTDEFGDVAGSIKVDISTNGTINVDISALYAQILAENQKAIQIRAIRGAILKVSLSVETANVAVNLDTSSVSSTVVFAIVQTTAPTPTTSPTTSSNAPSPVPTTTKPSLSTASRLETLTGLIVACIVMYIN